tara:strand:+ start:756 stop:1079 length:324 start_codon:yes stop_codon:yes gene_type:complete
VSSIKVLKCLLLRYLAKITLTFCYWYTDTPPAVAISFCAFCTAPANALASGFIALVLAGSSARFLIMIAYEAIILAIAYISGATLLGQRFYNNEVKKITGKIRQKTQ